MKHFLRAVCVAFGVCLVFSCKPKAANPTAATFGKSSKAIADVLENTPKLQKTARLANGGALGCGEGKITLITSNGTLTTRCGLDPIHVFGSTIDVSDLLVILNARAKANRKGKGPMSGEVGDLCYVCLYTLSFANDPRSIPVIASLLTDGDDGIQGWAAIALYRIGEASPAMRKQIQAISFPGDSIASARARGEEPPAWLEGSG